MANMRGGRPDHLHRHRSAAWLGVLALAMLAACSGGGDDSQTTATRPGGDPPETRAPRPTTTDLDLTVEQPDDTTTTSTEAPPPTDPPQIESVGTALTAPSIDGESVELAELVGPYFGNPLFAVADRRERLGEPRQLAIWSSPDGRDWVPVGGATLGSPADTDVTAAAWIGEQFAVGADLPDDSGARVPRVWLSPDAATFGAPEDPFGGLHGSITAMVASDEGLVVLGQVYESDVPETKIALRDANGVWTVTSLPSEANATGLAANGGTVVATGSVTVGQLQQAAAWASIDGGRTFSPADASPFAGGVSTAIGAVAGYPAGFVGIACVGDGDGATTAVATSNDGYVWQRLPLDVVYANEDGRPYPNRGSACNHISFGGDRFYVGGYDIDGVQLVIRPDGVGQALRFPLDVETIATGEPQAAMGPAGWVSIAPLGRGLLGTAELVAGYLYESTGLPQPGRTVFPPTFRPTTEGITAGVGTYPEIEATDDGGFVWGPRTEWFESPDGGAWLTSELLNTIDAAGIVSNGSTDVAWASVDDPGDDGRAGPIGGTAIWVDTPDAEPTEVGVVAGGVGGQVISDVVAVPSGYVAVGYSSVRDTDTGFTPVTPLVFVAPPDGLGWSQESPPMPAGDAQIDLACALADGTVLALGQAIVGGSATMYLLRRGSDAAWTMVDPAAFPAGVLAFDDCTASTAGALLVTTLDGEPTAFFTADGVTFEEADIASAVGDDVAIAFTSYPRGFIAIGEERADADANIVIWFSRDGVAWKRHDVVGLGGPGQQLAGDVIVAGTRLVVGGTTDGAPVVWAAPLP